MKKRKWKKAGAALAILPAVLLGVLAMIADGISPVLWGQQIAALVVFAMISLLSGRALRRMPAGGWTAALVVFLAATLFGTNVGGARRWIDLIVFNVNAAMLILPALLVLLAGMKRPIPSLLLAAAVLSFQPDFSQFCALAAAAVPLLWRGEGRRSVRLLAFAVLAALGVNCLRFRVTIESVSYSEGVLAMLGALSPLLMAVGVLALALIPGYWAYRFAREKAVFLLSLSVYYALVILFGLSGAYPVPFMGFGLSPIAGYCLALLFIMAEN